VKNTYLAAAVALALGGAIAPAVNAAKPTPPDALADIYPGGCDIVQIPPLGTSLVASWTWANGGDQTKFGGSVYCNVLFVDETTEAFEFELERYVPGTSAEENAGMFVYRCEVAETDPAGTCHAGLLGLRPALREAIESAGYSVDDVVSTNCNTALVKAMNPGHGNGPQNYPLVDVCGDLQ
jgi:hypothetical protein